MKYDFIYITGPDGVGKTTQAELIVNNLKNKGFNAEYRWLRFHHFFSLPLLAVARYLKYSEVIEKDDAKIGYHYFYKSKLISSLYPPLLLLDTILFNLIKLYIPLYISKKVIVSDRFVYDTLIDAITSTRNYDLVSSLFERILIKLIPKNQFTILLITDIDHIRKRRTDLQLDKCLPEKIKLYKKLGNEFQLRTIDANLSIEDVNQLIMSDLNEPNL